MAPCSESMGMRAPAGPTAGAVPAARRCASTCAASGIIRSPPTTRRFLVRQRKDLACAQRFIACTQTGGAHQRIHHHVRLGQTHQVHHGVHAEARATPWAPACSRTLGCDRLRRPGVHRPRQGGARRWARACAKHTRLRACSPPSRTISSSSECCRTTSTVCVPMEPVEPRTTMRFMKASDHLRIQLEPTLQERWLVRFTS